MLNKKCNKCGGVFPSTNFHKSKAHLDGFRSTCKECRKTEECPVRKKARKKAYRLANRKPRVYKEPRCKKEMDREYYVKNKERIKARTKEYAVKHRVSNRHKTNVAARKRRECPISRLKDNLRGGIYKGLAKKGRTKNNTTEDIIGCSFLQLHDHLKQTFEDNYKVSWDDSYEEHLHIDHKICLSEASNAESLYQLNYYTNLQYLYKFDNLSKGSDPNWSLDLGTTSFYRELYEKTK